MPMVEVDEVELQKSKKLRDTVEKMLKNPKTRRSFLEAHKAVDPDTPIPELDMTAPVREEIDATAKRITELEKKIETDAADRERAAKLQSLESKRTEGIATLRRAGWTNEGITGVEKIMEEQGILDPAIAAAYFEKQHPPQAPVKPAGSGGWNFADIPTEENNYAKKLLETKGQIDAIVDREANDALHEFRSATAHR